MTSRGRWLTRLFAGGWDGRHGRPRSSNGASSLHLTWELPAGEWTAVEATLEVIDPPTTADLYFWAMQVSFSDRGRRKGGAHLGLQWYPRHPGNTAVNWGGYGEDGRELLGSESALPSATANPNTRDFAWRAGRPYRLRIAPAAEPSPSGERAWRGTVEDDSGSITVVRDLWAGGETIDGPVVWSEVFAPCDAPGTAVRWSELRAVDAAGRAAVVDRVRVNYQRTGDGGCVTTDSAGDASGFVQRTGTTRSTSQGTVLSRGR